ncbi:MAG: DMT family transporter [Desulfovibrionaceae bacterium]
MDNLPFLLVILSALAHGSWNFLFKQALDKDAFLGCTKIAEPVMYALPFAFAAQRWELDLSMWLYVGVGAVLSIANYVLLANAYKRLDLALAYPISRSSTLFLPLLAYMIFGETIDGAGWASVLLVSAGVVVIQRRPRHRAAPAPHERARERAGVALAVASAFTVALYTLWGRVAVTHMHPFLYMYCYTVLTGLYFYPSLARCGRTAVRREWRANKWRILGVSFLNTFSYVLMLFALNMSKLAYVGALRQLSLVFGVALGGWLLKEAITLPRLLGVTGIVVGACLTYFAR